MFADALREVRYHRGRVVATLLAIAISVGFMAAVSTFISTQQHALGVQISLPASKADVVATVNTIAPSVKNPPTVAEIGRTIAGVSGVQTSERIVSGSVAFDNGDKSVDLQLYGLLDPTFRWSSLRSGAWPATTHEVALSSGAAKKLGVGVGDTLTTGGSGSASYKVVGITTDPNALFTETGYLVTSDPLLADDQQSEGSGNDVSGQWIVRAAAGTKPEAVRDGVAQALAKWNDTTDTPDNWPITVRTGAEEQQHALTALTGSFNVIKYMLMAFAGVAALVGIIIIATTFTILLAQRRRQIGLMRAVGASGQQVRRRLLAEAVIIGAIGSLAGLVLGIIVAALGAAYTHSLAFGLKLPWLSLGIEWVVGIVITVIAAVVPAHRATRVAPLEALRPVATMEQRRASVVRSVICAVLGAAGVVLVVLSITSHHQPLLRAVGGAALLSLAILFGAPLYVPWIIRGFGRLIRPFGSTARLAASNAVRNPTRSSATATALMLAVGLIVTLQVGTASVRSTYLSWIEERYPVDITVTSMGSMNGSDRDSKESAWLPTTALDDLATVRNITKRATIDGRTLTDKEADGQAQNVYVWSSQITQFKGAPDEPNNQTVLMSEDWGDLPKTITLKLQGSDHTFAVVGTHALSGGDIMVSSGNASLFGTIKPVAVWMQVADRSNLGPTFTDLQKIVNNHYSNDVLLGVGGGAFYAYIIDQVLNALLMTVTALLGVAVLIALIGVGNTLGLSVIERQRESALLRAMGMQKRSLRIMLLWEAVILALSGVVVGVVMGGFFGWLGVYALLKQVDSAEVSLHFAINWWQTLAMIVIAFLAAALASILPGRRAAKASPVASLAEE